MLRWSLLSWCLALVTLVGGEWQPIPKEVWEIRSGGRGAVVLEERLALMDTHITTVYRVRIFSEEGRAAANLPDLPPDLKEFQGRTVYPDGRMVAFNAVKDLARREIKVGEEEGAMNHLVVPGVTPDCVVEVVWSEWASQKRGILPARFNNGYFWRWYVGRPFPILKFEVETPSVSPSLMVTHIRNGRGPACAFSQKDGMNYYKFKDVPPADAIPYSLQTTENHPLVDVYYKPSYGRGKSGPMAYWDGVADVHLRRAYDRGVQKGTTFQKLVDRVGQGLPAGDQAKASEVLLRLDDLFHNVSWATPAERSGLGKEGLQIYDLDLISRSSETTSHGMRLLFLHVLKALGLKPKIARVPNRNFTLFQSNIENAWVFERDLIGIEEEGKGILWMDPSLRYASPGVVRPEYTAIPALVVDATTWTTSVGVVAESSHLSNRKSFEYALELGEDSDTFTLKATFAGIPEHYQRAVYLPKSELEQSTHLKEILERRTRGGVITTTRVNNAWKPRTKVAWEIEGSVEHEAGRQREVNPFPGLDWPLQVPDQLPEVRTNPVILPYLFTYRATSTFEIPKGFSLLALPDLEESNAFGKVIWSSKVDPETRRATITISAEAIRVVGLADQWGDFKAYLGWIADACRRKVVLQKTR